MSTPSVPIAAASFRHFFSELREAFLERDNLLTQIELALLSKEHVLVVGPPGTAKSALASAVLGRIVDAGTGAPSLFAKQLSETTMQSDLIGPVDFKVLTETGRTEYLTDDGMLGATHAFLDEVFDGRDMLLRSILNVLHERELKHGRRLTAGKIECAIMTSNRYLSEVVARSPELLWAFADRLSFVSFVPKAFAHPQSRAAMLARANRTQRFELKAPLTLQDLDVLQAAVGRVEVPADVLELLERLAEELERTLTAQTARIPDYVPTKSFSQRATVKALWALKAAVVRDLVWHRPHRPLIATVEDLAALRSFFALGGPSLEDVEQLIKSAVDPREKNQLESIRLEHRAFTEALARVKEKGIQGPQREAATLQCAEALRAAEALSRAFQVSSCRALLERLRHELVPGPRHPENRDTLTSAARLVLSAIARQLGEGSEGEVDLAQSQELARAVTQALLLAELVPELRARLPGLAASAERFSLRAYALAALSSEARELDGLLEGDALVGRVKGARDQIGAFSELGAQVGALRPDARARIDADESTARRRIVQALHRHALVSLSGARGSVKSPGQFLARSRELQALDRSIQEIAPYTEDVTGVRDSLLTPLAQTLLTEALAAPEGKTVTAVAAQLESVAEAIRREGLPIEAALASVQQPLNQALEALAQAADQVAPVLPSEGDGGDGRAYSRYRDHFPTSSLGSELAALDAIDLQAGDRGPLVSGAVRQRIGEVELQGAGARVTFIRAWFGQLSAARIEEATASRVNAAIDQLVKSRLAQLVLREGETLRIAAAITQVEVRAPALLEKARGLRADVEALHQEIAETCRQLLSARTGHALGRGRVG